MEQHLPYTHPHVVQNYLIISVKYGAALAENTTDNISDLLLTKENMLLGANYSAVVQIDPETLRTRKISGGFSSLSHLTEDPVTGSLYVFDKTELYKIDQN